MKWTAREIARSLHWHALNGRHVVVVPDCNWTGHECDLLVVRADLRLVDIEIKISRSDLKADAAKDKWFDMPNRCQWNHPEKNLKIPRAHPPKIWKHYYCMPAAIWDDKLLEAIQPMSGIMLIRDYSDGPLVTIKRQARANKSATPISPQEVIDIARLQSNRMWNAYDEVDSFRRERESSKQSPSQAPPEPESPHH